MSTNSLMAQHEFARQTQIEHGLLESLIRGLRTALAWEAADDQFTRKVSTVRFIFQSFQRHLQRLMNLEEIDGYMDSVLEANPRFSKRVVSLKDEHAFFRQKIGELAQRLERVSPMDYDRFAGICHDVDRLLERLDEHSRDEAKLFLQAFAEEEGGEG